MLAQELFASQEQVSGGAIMFAVDEHTHSSILTYLICSRNKQLPAEGKRTVVIHRESALDVAEARS